MSKIHLRATSMLLAPLALGLMAASPALTSSSSSTPDPTAPLSSTPVPTAPPSSSPSPTDPPAPEGWNLVWSDEFDGDAVDASKWEVLNNSPFGHGNGELACLMNRPENVAVKDGQLHINALRKESPIKCGSRGDYSYTSGHLTTKDRAAFTYGRFEMRAQLPTAPGVSKAMWPAFWLRPVDGGIGEIDIMEAVGSTQGDTSVSSKAQQTIHYDYKGTHDPQDNEHTFQSGLPSDGMHVYAVEWEESELRWYIDDELVYTRNAETTPWLKEAFSRDFFIRLNLAVGSTYLGAPDEHTQFPATYAVDYVRVYQR